MKTIVYQSYRTENVPQWISKSMDSVAHWAALKGFDYRFYGDEMFERVPQWYREKTKDRLVVATDLGRLMLAKELLLEGYERVIWCDADMLVFAPQEFDVQVHEEYAFGREVWIQQDGKGRLKAFNKIHNAFFVFSENNSFLDFYIHSCLSIIKRIEGQMVPQIVGPKFLSAIHNIVACPIVEEAGMFSPLVMKDILNGGGRALDLLKEKSPSPLYAGNLSASMEGAETDGVCLSPFDMEKACEHLLEKGRL
ncbi:conserved hypothetical protein [Candidatus Terasakiella magnetica]|uniref:Nucleotide-diphospho-sugar transferase domain-containing protein n=1 Tax=Candidatus Terasakiella magnetica TaxID=1867952 RepID=A0A1C3RJI7_9PROT|nr:hypothetical protein [Candidatus Terasakiella magnetica]SCA57442.1 conserved hypothetical protein [Candidatus Terasakiella magnetica]